MIKYNIKNIKSIQKKENLLYHSRSTVDKLNSINLFDLYGNNYISPSGNTLKDYIDLVDRLKRCSSNILLDIFKKVDTTTGEITEKFKISESNRCNIHTLCPVCASAKRNKIIYELSPYIQALRKMEGIYFYIATITIENSEKPSLAYDKLRRSWTDFIKRGQRRGNNIRSGGESAKIIGSLLSIEIIETERKGFYHVHGHVLMITDEKINYQVYDKEKKRDLQKIYGDNIPENELIKIINDYIVYNERIVPLSKLTREWFDSSGAVNFWIKPIKDGISEGRYLTIEDHLRETIKYVCKPWQVSAENIIDLFDSIIGKKRITKAGIFLKRNRKYWYRLIIKNNLKSFWKKYLKMDEDIEDSLIIEREILSLQYDKEGYKVKDEQDAQKYEVYKKVRKSYDIKKGVLLNKYRSDFSLLKKLIGVIENVDWIERKEMLKRFYRKQHEKIKSEFILDLKMQSN